MYWRQTRTGDDDGDGDEEEESGEKPHAFCVEFKSHPHLDDAVHVRDEAVNADFQQHDQSPAHVLPHFTVLVTSQGKQTLDTRERRSTEATSCAFICHALPHSHLEKDPDRVSASSEQSLLFYIIDNFLQSRVSSSTNTTCCR